jgi:2-oxoglutarate dehydrogenase E2 component (dihydrolipoamide succinyltransferase)
VEVGQDGSVLSSNNSEPHVQEKAVAIAASVTAAPPASITSGSGSKEREANARQTLSITKTESPQEGQSPKPKRGENQVRSRSDLIFLSLSVNLISPMVQVKMTRIRQKTAQHLKESQKTAAFLTTYNEVDMSKIIELRKKHKDAVLENHGVKLDFLGVMANASVLALKEISTVNASI